MPNSAYLVSPEVFLANVREVLDVKIALTREANGTWHVILLLQ